MKVSGTQSGLWSLRISPIPIHILCRPLLDSTKQLGGRSKFLPKSFRS